MLERLMTLIVAHTSHVILLYVHHRYIKVTQLLTIWLFIHIAINFSTIYRMIIIVNTKMQ